MNWRTLLLRLALPLLVLNGLLSFGNRWPGLWPQPEWRLSVEVAALVLLLQAWPRLRRLLPTPGRAVGRSAAPAPAGRAADRALAALAAVFSLWVVLHYVDVTVPAVLGRPLNIYWDGRHLWQVLRMAGADGAPWRPLALLAGLGVAVAGLYLLVRRCLGALVRGLAETRLRPALALACTTALLGGAFASRIDTDLRRAFAPPVAALLAEQAGLLARSLSPSYGEQRLGAGPTFERDLDALHGADVLIVFAEAYGAVTLDRPEIATALAQARQALEQAIDATGRRVVSARVRSPTFGGASWLAHAALLAGIDTRDPDDYRLLLSSRRPTLVKHFARHGYRTVGWMPGLQRPWPEGAFYGFERREGADGIGYAGPAFGYWRIPDQASMALLQAQELAPPGAGGDAAATRRPRFMVFPTVSTHAPFAPLPPYVEDWQRVGGPLGFSPDAPAGALSAAGSWTTPTPAYVAAMRYQFRWLAAWLREHAPAELLLIVIGDHQPIGAVTGPGASWEVPVHVVGRDPVVLARLQAAGFGAGLQPQPPAIGPMHALTQILLDAFAR